MLSLVSLAWAAGGSFGTYRNDQFGFSVSIPSGAATCRPGPDEPDYGIDIALDLAGGCSSDQPSMGVYGAYGDWLPLSAPLAELCVPRPGERSAAAPLDLALAGRPSASCRVDSDDRADTALYVVTQAQTDDGMAQIEYTAALHTTPQRFDADLQRFRALLRTGIALQPPAHEPRRYRNGEFGFSVEIPDGAPTCRSRPPQHDHGIDFYLDGGKSGCKDLQARPYIGAGGSYNAAELPTPETALGSICTHRGSTRGAAPHGLAIAGLPSASCRGNSADGKWIDVFVSAQNGDPASINYEANLHTTPERFDADLVRFRAFLAAGLKVDQAK
jgi:hypothetical protein